MHIDPKPFDAANYEDKFENRQDANPDALAHDFKSYVENTVRWRYGRTAAGGVDFQRKDSNARFVRWSDGSTSLLIGMELFDVAVKHDDPSFTQYIAVQHPEEDVFQIKADVTSKMDFRPISTKTETHRILTKSIASRYQKSVKTKFMITTQDPEKEKQEAGLVSSNCGRY